MMGRPRDMPAEANTKPNMSSILLTGPAIEPLSLDEVKAFLHVEHSDDDQVVSALIAGARTTIVLTAYFGGRGLEKIVRPLMKK
jgi:hypothetical protein